MIVTLTFNTDNCSWDLVFAFTGFESEIDAVRASRILAAVLRDAEIADLRPPHNESDTLQ